MLSKLLKRLRSEDAFTTIELMTVSVLLAVLVIVEVALTQAH